LSNFGEEDREITESVLEEDEAEEEVQLTETDIDDR